MDIAKNTLILAESFDKKRIPGFVDWLLDQCYKTLVCLPTLIFKTHSPGRKPGSEQHVDHLMKT